MLGLDGEIRGWDFVEWDMYTPQELWHITDPEGLYHSLAASLCGLGTPLAMLMKSDNETLNAVVGSALYATLFVHGKGYQDLYSTVFVPLYNLLGLSEGWSAQRGGYRSDT